MLSSNNNWDSNHEISRINKNNKSSRWIKGAYISLFITIFTLLVVPNGVVISNCKSIYIWFVVMLFASTIAFFLLQGSNPGYITESYAIDAMHVTIDGDKNINDTENGSTKSEREYCRRCCIQRPLRSHHCRACRRCVAMFDHHCHIIGTCVGERNHFRFWLFLFLQSIEMMLGLVIGHLALRSNLGALSENAAHMALIIQYSCSALCFPLLFMHTAVAIYGTTGHEFQSDNDREMYAYDNGKEINYSVLSNVHGFCCIRDDACRKLKGEEWQPSRWILCSKENVKRGRLDYILENEYWSCC